MRFRLGNGMRANRYWENEEKKLCRLCRGGGIVLGACLRGV